MTDTYKKTPVYFRKNSQLKLKSKGTLVTMRLIGILCKTKIISVNYAENPVGNFLKVS